jgi:hypothetical protein
MSTMRVFLGSLACLLLAAGFVPVQAETGLRLGQSTGAQQATWPRWQARVGLATIANATDAGAPWQVSGGQLLGDYYWGGMRLGGSGGVGSFRATSGVLLGQRSLALGTSALTSGPGTGLTLSRSVRPAIPVLGDVAHEPWSAAPYIGVGYSGVSLRGGWGFTADVGLAGGAGGLYARRDSALGTQGLDDLLRELRLRPVLQVGASYAF